METIGRYQLQGELGRGGMGVVYRAYDPELDREVALKSVKLDGATPEQKAVSEQNLAREARAAARLQHPHAVAVHDFFTNADKAFIVMEFVRGTSLEAMLAGGAARDMAEALRILREAAEALDAAHLAGIVHRDVKPGNILLDAGGRVKIADFGIARFTTGNMTQTAPSIGGTAGTLSYMSPEQVRGDRVDGRSDQFALAVVAYQLFTGQLPFQAETWVAQSYKILNEVQTPARTINPQLPPAVDAALGVALQKDPLRRFPTCTSFVDALAAGLPAAAAKGFSKSRVVMAVLLVAASVAVTAMIYRALNTIQTPVPQTGIAATPEAAAVDPLPAATQPVPVTAPEADPPADSLAVILDGIPMDFARIEPGRFVMGCGSCDESQKPDHMVEISKVFQMGRTEVTEKHWNAVMTGKATGSDKPRVNVSWNEAQQFLAKLNGRNDGFHYRLPTEAEWEYAARANDPREYPKNLSDVAWTSSNSQDQIREIASAKMSNLWGLYDMLGNVSEWTADWFDPAYYPGSPAKNPKGPAAGKMRVFRGGNGGTGDMVASYAYRFADEPDAKGPWLGFRVVRERR